MIIYCEKPGFGQICSRYHSLSLTDSLRKLIKLLTRELCKPVLLLNICVIEILKSSSRPVGTAVSKFLFPKAFGMTKNPGFAKPSNNRNF